MKNSVKLNGGAVCLTCGMLYKAKDVDGCLTFTSSEPPFKCDCGASTFVASKQIKIGHKFPCRACKRTFVIAEVDWKYSIVGDVEAAED